MIWMAYWFSLVIATSLPVNGLILRYINDKPLGIQTVLDHAHQDLLRTNLVLICGFSLTVVTRILNGPMPYDVAWFLSWTIYGTVLAFVGFLSSALLLRYLRYFHWRDLEEVEDRYVIFMTRATTSMCAILLTTFCERQSDTPFLQYLSNHRITHQGYPRLHLDPQGFLQLFVIITTMGNAVAALYLGNHDEMERQRLHSNSVQNLDHLDSLPTARISRSTCVILALAIFAIVTASTVHFPPDTDGPFFSVCLGIFFQGCLVPSWIIFGNRELLTYIQRRIWWTIHPLQLWRNRSSASRV